MKAGEKGPPVLPSPLEADDLRVLRWIGERPRECAVSPPSGFNFVHMAACRRKLWRQGLVELDCPSGKLPCVYVLTAAGEKLLAEVKDRERPGRKASAKRGRSKVG